MFAGKAFESRAQMLRYLHSGGSAAPIATDRIAESRVVRRAVDGDTLVLEHGERVRLIGVDTPETRHPTKPVEYFGREALRFTKRMAEGKRVRLEFDQANAATRHQDRYQRAAGRTHGVQTGNIADVG